MRAVRVVSLLLGGLPLAAFTAHAADQPDTIDEVVITASRSPESAATYAGSVSSISQQDIELLGATHHAEIFNRVPGAMFQRNSGQESLSAIRSPVLSGPGSCGSFLFLEDSIPIRPVGFCNVNELFEVDPGDARAVEVLRGPAGALYGSSAMHGAVNVIQPDASMLPELGVSLERGPDEFYRARATGSYRGDVTSAGLSVMSEYDGGWRIDSLTRQNKVAGSLETAIGEDKLTVRLTGTDLNQNTAGFIQGFESYKDPAIAASNANPEAYRKAQSLRLAGHYEMHFADADAFTVDLRPYLRQSRMNFIQHFLVGKPIERNGQDSGGLIASLRYAPGHGTEIITGADGELSNSYLYEFQAGPATDGAPAANIIRPAGKHYDYNVHSRVLAAYAQLHQQLGARLLATAGVRVERVRYDYDNHMSTGNAAESGATCPGGCLFNRPADRSDDFDGFTPSAGLSYTLNAQNSLYVSAARGYRAPDTSELYRLQRQQSVADLNPERLDNIEVGARGRYSRFGYSLAVFDMKKDNLILREANGFNVSNGKTKHRGVEYEFTTLAFGQRGAAQSLALSLAGTYAKHTYDFNRSVDGGETIVAGRDVDTAPRRVYSARADYQPLRAVDLELEWQHVGDYYVDAANAHSYAGYDLLNLRGSWEFRDHWSVAARLNNLTDVAYADRADYAFGNYRYFPGRERALFLELGFKAQRD